MLTKRLFGSIALLGALVMGAASCGSVTDHPTGDCDTHRRFRLRYTKNLLQADAVRSQVRSATLYLFNEQGVYQQSLTASLPELQAHDFCVPADGLAEGSYQLVAWCGTEGREELWSELTPGVSKLADLTCTLPAESNRDWHEPEAIFHHHTSFTTETRPGGTQEVEVSLMKDINHLTVMLQSFKQSLSADEFRFQVVTQARQLAYDNTPSQNVTFTPCEVKLAEVSGIVQGKDTEVTAVVAELSLGRLMADRNARLQVTKAENGDSVLDIPLAEYLTMVKGHYGKFTDQEYLDYQDNYSVTFLLDAGNRWDRVNLMVNGWKVVCSDETLGKD